MSYTLLTRQPTIDDWICASDARMSSTVMRCLGMQANFAYNRNLVAGSKFWLEKSCGREDLLWLRDGLRLLRCKARSRRNVQSSGGRPLVSRFQNRKSCCSCFPTPQNRRTVPFCDCVMMIWPQTLLSTTPRERGEKSHESKRFSTPPRLL